MPPRRKIYLDNTAPADNTANVVRPVNRMIQVKRQDTPARREKETREYQARVEQGQRIMNSFARTPAGRRAANRAYAIESQKAKQEATKEEAAAVVGSLFKPIIPSTYVDMAAAIKNGQVNNLTDALAAPYLSDSWSMRNPGKALVVDLAAPFAVAKGTQLVNRGTRGLKLARAMNRSLQNPEGAFYNEGLIPYSSKTYTLDNPYAYRLSPGVRDYFYNGIYPQRVSKSNLTWGEKHGFPKGERNIKYKTNPNAGQNVDTNLTLFNATNSSIADQIRGDGTIRWTMGSNRLTSGDGMLRPTSHFTTDQRVLPHSAGNWDLTQNTILYPMQQAIYDNGIPRSIMPMDTFWGYPENFMMDATKMKVITSNPSEYRKLKSLGIDVHFNSEGRSIKNMEKHSVLPFETVVDNESLIHSGLDYDNPIVRKARYQNNLSDRIRWQLGIDNRNSHMNIADRLVARPTLQDYQSLEEQTGFLTGVHPKSTGGMIDHNMDKSLVNYYHAPAIHQADLTYFLEQLTPNKDFFGVPITYEEIARRFNVLKELRRNPNYQSSSDQMLIDAIEKRLKHRYNRK